MAQRLVAAGEVVIDVPSRKSSLVRAFSSSRDAKTDYVDAYSVALAALHSPGLERAAWMVTPRRCGCWRSGG
jgi:hypothetical protein